MTSILEGKNCIEGNLEISESPWFKLNCLLDFERLLLYAFESTTLAEEKDVPGMFQRSCQAGQTVETEVDDVREKSAKRQKVR